MKQMKNLFYTKERNNMEVGKLDDKSIQIITEATDLIQELRLKYTYLDPKTFSLLLELKEALDKFDL